MIARAEKALATAEADRRSAQGRVLTATENLELARVKEKNLQLATVLIQEVAKETQDKLKFHIEDMVQSAIDAVFPETYKFCLTFEPKRGRTEVSIYLEKDGTQIFPMDATGGGVVDVVSFALRVVSWSISSTSNTLFLDEPMKWVSQGLRPRCAELLRALSDKLDLQIIMVTHDEELVAEADAVFVVDQKRRRSFVVRREGVKQ